MKSIVKLLFLRLCSGAVKTSAEIPMHAYMREKPSSIPAPFIHTVSVHSISVSTPTLHSIFIQRTESLPLPVANLQSECPDRTREKEEKRPGKVVVCCLL